jgi:hypothetical protein
MAEKVEINAKRDTMRFRKKETTCASFIDLTKRPLEI